MKLEISPDHLIEEYNLCKKIEPNGYVYAEIRKGMYGLPQAELLAPELLPERLKKYGYTQSIITSDPCCQ